MIRVKITYDSIISIIRDDLCPRIFDRLNQLHLDSIDALVIPKSSLNFANDLFYELGPKVGNIELLPCNIRGDLSNIAFEDVCLGSKSVLIVDSILDTGFTMMTVVNNLKERVENIITCSLLKKLRKDKVCYYDNPEHIYGFLISDYFAVGYGLDYNQKFRNIKNIFDYKEVDRYIKISGLDSFYEFSSNL
jgi:hypoxanthine phosphoribosyltransferase